MSIGGSSYARSSTQAWAGVPLLDPSAAIMMQSFINPPTKLSEADLTTQLAGQGVTGVKFEGRLVGLVPDFFGTCLYEITVKSGDTIIYSQKTWIGPNDNLRYKFEAKDETRTVTETRLFNYEPVNLTAPVP